MIGLYLKATDRERLERHAQQQRRKLADAVRVIVLDYLDKEQRPHQAATDNRA